IEGVAPGEVPYEALMDAQQPAVLKGLARDWPLAQRGLRSTEEAIAYLKRFEGERPVVGYTGAPETEGRFFYNADMSGLNFEAARVPLGEFLDRIGAHLDAGDGDAPSFYIGSTDLDTYLPGLRAENGLALDHPMFAANPPTVSIWIGNRTVASAHYDMSNNLACS